jgi:hypothetical protein
MTDAEHCRVQGDSQCRGNQIRQARLPRAIAHHTTVQLVKPNKLSLFWSLVWLLSAVLACDKYKTSGQLLATTTVKLGAHIGT